MKETGRLADLGNLIFYVVKNLTVKYVLFNETRFHSKEIILDGTNVIVQENHITNLDIIAGEINKFCGNLKGFDDFLSALFTKKSPQDVEAYLDRKKISKLPDEELIWFETGERIQEDEEWYEEESSFYDPSDEATLNEDLESQLPESEFKILDRTEKTFPLTRRRKKHYRKKTQIKSFKSPKEWIPEVKPEEAQIILDDFKFEGDLINFDEILVNDSAINDSSIKKDKIPTKIPDKHTSSQFNRINLNNELLSKEIYESRFDDTFNFQDSATSKKIGDWGERYVFRVLEEHYKKKYPRLSIEKTEERFSIYKGKKVYVHIKWLNLNFDAPGRDIELIEDGIKYFIEIKSTKTEKLKKFRLSRIQLRLMRQFGEKYHIYRVFNAGKKNARILKIVDPAKLVKEGKIRIDSAEIRI